MAYGAFGSITNIAETLVKMSPLVLAGLAVAIAFRGGFWSIGAEGQIYFGALGAAAISIVFRPTSTAIGVPLALLAGFAAGALWALLPGILRIRWQVNEVVATLMLNYVAIFLIQFVVSRPWRDRMFPEPATPPFSSGVQLPILVKGTRLHAGIAVAALAVVAVSIMLSRTTFGFRLNAAGLNKTAAFLNRIGWNRVILTTLLISGGLAGLAGVGEVSGVHHRLVLGFSPGYGYQGIAVAMLGRGSPVGTLVSASFFAALLIGAEEMQRRLAIPSAIVLIMQGIVILFVLMGDSLVRRLLHPQA